MTKWVIFFLGVALGLWVGDNWRTWVSDGIEWGVAISAVVGVIAIVVGSIALAAGWRP